MLEFMRRSTNSVFIYVIFGVIIASFLFTFNTPGGGCEGAVDKEMLATLYGERIDKDVVLLKPRQSNPNADFSRQSEGEMSELVNRLLTDDGVSYFDNPFTGQSQWNYSLITEFILADAAKKNGLAVSFDDVNAFILDKDRSREAAVFQVRDKFDAERYENVVRGGFRMAIKQYQASKSRELLASIMRSLLADSVHLSDIELKERFVHNNTKIDAEYIKVPAPKNPEVAAEDVEKYIKESPEELTKYYDLNKRDFQRDAQFKVHQFFLSGKRPADKDAAEITKKWSDNQKLATEIHAELKAVLPGEQLKKFGDLAAEKGSELFKQKRGSIGWTTVRENDENYGKALEKLSKGQLSGVVETDLGHYVLYVEDTKTALDRKVDDAEVKKEIAQEKLKGLAMLKATKNKANALVKLYKEGGYASFEKFAETLNTATSGDESQQLDVKTTGSFARRALYRGGWAQVPALGDALELTKKLFDLKEGELLAEPYVHKGEHYLFRAASVETADLSKFDSQKKSLKDQWLRQKRSEVLKEWVALNRKNAEAAGQVEVVAAAKAVPASAPADKASNGS